MRIAPWIISTLTLMALSRGRAASLGLFALYRQRGNTALSEYLNLTTEFRCAALTQVRLNGKDERRARRNRL